MLESITGIVNKAKSLYLRFDLDYVAAVGQLTKNQLSATSQTAAFETV